MIRDSVPAGPGASDGHRPTLTHGPGQAPPREFKSFENHEALPAAQGIDVAP